MDDYGKCLKECDKKCKGQPMERELEYWAPGASQSLPIRVLVGAPTLHSE